MNYRTIEINGCQVTLWEAICNDCGFLSGLAQVHAGGGYSYMLSGAGCFSRRGPKEALAWATEKTLQHEPGHQATTSIGFGDQINLGLDE